MLLLHAISLHFVVGSRGGTKGKDSASDSMLGRR
jgi:hypothetical protein